MKKNRESYKESYEALQAELTQAQADFGSEIAQELVKKGIIDPTELLVANDIGKNILENGKRISRDKKSADKDFKSPAKRARTHLEKYANLRKKIQSTAQISTVIEDIKASNTHNNLLSSPLIRHILNDNKLSQDLQKTPSKADRYAVITNHFDLDDPSRKTLASLETLYRVKPTLISFYSLVQKANQHINLYESESPSNQNTQTRVAITQLHQQISEQMDAFTKAVKAVNDATNTLQSDITSMDTVYEKQVFSAQKRLNFLTPGVEAATVLNNALHTLPNNLADLSAVLDITQQNKALSFEQKMLFKHVLRRAYSHKKTLSKSELSNQLDFLAKPVAWTPPGKTRSRSADTHRTEPPEGTFYLEIGLGLETELRTAGQLLSDSHIDITQENLMQQLFDLLPENEEELDLLIDHIDMIFSENSAPTHNEFQQQLTSMNHDILVFQDFAIENNKKPIEAVNKALPAIIKQMKQTMKNVAKADSPLREAIQTQEFRSEVRRYNETSKALEGTPNSFFKNNRLRELEGLEFKLKERIQESSPHSLDEHEVDQQFQLAQKVINLVDLKKEAVSLLNDSQSNDPSLAKQDILEKFDAIKDSPLIDEIKNLSHSEHAEAKPGRQA